MTIYERALEFVPDGAAIGLGSGRAAWAFVALLGERIGGGAVGMRGVPTSHETAAVAAAHGVPLIGMAEAGELALAVDGADEVDPDLNLIKGYGRALVREKVVAAVSRRLVILVGEEKRVPRLGSRGRLPVEVVPFAAPLCERRLATLGLRPVLWETDGHARRDGQRQPHLRLRDRPDRRPTPAGGGPPRDPRRRGDWAVPRRGRHRPGRGRRRIPTGRRAADGTVTRFTPEGERMATTVTPAKTPTADGAAPASISAFGKARATVGGAPLSADELRKIDAYWRACNYLALGMIYLRDNPLLREPLKPEHIKNRLLGHWGSSPGLAFCLRPPEPADQDSTTST